MQTPARARGACAEVTPDRRRGNLEGEVHPHPWRPLCPLLGCGGWAGVLPPAGGGAWWRLLGRGLQCDLRPPPTWNCQPPTAHPPPPASGRLTQPRFTLVTVLQFPFSCRDLSPASSSQDSGPRLSPLCPHVSPAPRAAIAPSRCHWSRGAGMSVHCGPGASALGPRLCGVLRWARGGQRAR